MTPDLLGLIFVRVLGVVGKGSLLGVVECLGGDKTRAGQCPYGDGSDK